MNEHCLKLTIYFGERDRTPHGFLADELSSIYARHRLRTSLVMRGTQGFGIKHHLHTDRLLTLSEDLPLVSVAVDSQERIEAALAEVDRLEFDGLVTLERARMLTEEIQPVPVTPDLGESTKLTVYIGRHERADGRPTYEAVVDLLHRRGLAGATVLLGVDGTAHGERRRARFFAANTRIPLMVIAVGDGAVIAELLPTLGALLERPLITLERVRVCKRDGERLAALPYVVDADPSGLGIWQKLQIHSDEQARAGDQPLHQAVIHSLREAGASGATSLRGIWGYQGGAPPRGDSFWQLRRRVPVLTVVVDTPQRMRRFYPVIDAVTSEAGVVTSEIVPAFRATGPGVTHGELSLAQIIDR